MYSFPFGVLITSESFLVDSCLFRNTILHLVHDSFLLDVQVFLNNRPEPKNPCLDFFSQKKDLFIFDQQYLSIFVSFAKG